MKWTISGLIAFSSIFISVVSLAQSKVGEIRFEDKSGELIVNLLVDKNNSASLDQLRLMDGKNSEILLDKPFDCSNSDGLSKDTVFTSCKTKLHKAVVKEVEMDVKAVELKAASVAGEQVLASGSTRTYTLLPSIANINRPQSLLNGRVMEIIDPKYRLVNQLVISETPLGSMKPRTEEKKKEESKNSSQITAKVLNDGAGACGLEGGEKKTRGGKALYPIVILLIALMLYRARLRE